MLAQQMSSTEKRRIQNREAQRRHRISLKARLAELEAAQAFLQRQGYSLPTQIAAHPGIPASQPSLSPQINASLAPDWMDGHGSLLPCELTVSPGTVTPAGSVESVDPCENASWMRTPIQESRYAPVAANYSLGSASPGWSGASADVSEGPESTLPPNRELYASSPIYLGVPAYQQELKVPKPPSAPLNAQVANFVRPTVSLSDQCTSQNISRPKQGRRGPSPLHIAVLNLSIASVQVLCQHGANVHALDEHGRTPLHLCAGFPVQHGALASEMVSLLVSYGASVDARDENGETSMQRAARVDNYMTISTLAALGADVNFQ
ncbi:hypothetical protein PENANT_c027G00112 [Penicillium antarcticum]|uniref:Uncharacterized protein n=1 Tax=Penicillium antarcticum TaxID=416450 RepID=A0A1V6PWM5_9EURO|nr:hypothetical protein PENANT_c027G00112 [Penicillium antarcticum]